MKLLNVMSDLGSLILAIGIVVFFVGFPGYQPAGEYGMLIGIAVVLGIMAIYLAFEGSIVFAHNTPSPVYVAVETFISHIPGYALVWVAAAVVYGKTALSPFQWVAYGIILVVVLIDLIGIVAVVARQLLLTDEVKPVR